MALGLSTDLANIVIDSDITDLLNNNQIDADDSDDMFPISTFDIQTSNWNRVFFYRLIIAKLDGDTVKPIEIQKLPLIYNLPIGPQNLNISMPFATQTTVLADGILVESNGIPLKQISIQGTTGILPYRDTSATSFDNSAFAAFAPNIGRVASNVKSAVQAFNPADTAALIQKKQSIFENSGYAQFHKLSQFLQYYAFLSKKSKNKNLRLVLDLVKDNITYVVTPKNFSLQRSAAEPLEYKYSIQLEAWKRIKLSQSAVIGNTTAKKGLGDAAQAAVAAVIKAFKLIAALSDMVSAIRGDINRILDVVRTVTVTIKQIAGTIVSLLNLPQAILNDIKSTVQELQNTASAASTAIQNAWKGALQTRWGGKITANSDTSLVSAANSKTFAINSTNQQNTSGSSDVSNSTPSSADQSQASGTGDTNGNRLSQAFNDPYNPDNIDFFDSLNPSDLNLSSNIQTKINTELTRISNLTRIDFQNYRDYLNSVSADLAFAFGVGSASLNSIKNYVVSPSPRFNETTLNRTQYDLLSAFRDVANVLDALSATNRLPSPLNPLQQSFNFVGTLAASANMPFSSALGKFSAPVPYGATIQQIALQYLGDPDRATEIIILNRLQAPFIDEDGATQVLTGSSYKKTFNIADGSALYLNQKIIFYAGNVAPFSRKIVNLAQLSENNWQVTVDGSTDLGLTLAHNPYIQYFQKNTISSRDLIYIPSGAPAAVIPDALKPITSTSADSPSLLALAKIDILLDSSMDIVLDSRGELGVSAGLTNILQALKIKLSTPLGALIRHPGFGFGVQPGTPISEINIPSLNQNIRSTVISDPRFKDVLGTTISYGSSTLKIAGTASLNDVGSGILPFSFEI